jgi:hypothetical protein
MEEKNISVYFSATQVSGTSLDQNNASSPIVLYRKNQNLIPKTPLILTLRSCSEIFIMLYGMETVASYFGDRLFSFFIR